MPTFLDVYKAHHLGEKPLSTISDERYLIDLCPGWWRRWGRLKTPAEISTDLRRCERERSAKVAASRITKARVEAERSKRLEAVAAGDFRPVYWVTSGGDGRTPDLTKVHYSPPGAAVTFCGRLIPHDDPPFLHLHREKRYGNVVSADCAGCHAAMGTTKGAE